MKNKEIIQIISKSFDQGLSNDEQKSLDSWLSSSNENQLKYENYRHLWQQAETLASHDTINVEEALVKTKKGIKEFNTKKYSNSFLFKVAASVLLLISAGLGSGYFLAGTGTKQNIEAVVLQEIEAMNGTNTKLMLADGTNVWLNSGSKLTFPVSFNGAQQRRVVLSGEAYFDVTKDNDKPFIVETSDVDVRVHGTSFNVSAYGQDESVIVALVEGKVSLEKEIAGETKRLTVLKPNEVVAVNKKSESVTRITDMKMNQYTGWKDGLMVFYGDSIGTVAERLEKWYNVDIKIGKSLDNYRFTATIHNESLEHILDLLSLSSPMKYKVIPAKLNEDNTFSRRTVKLRRK